MHMQSSPCTQFLVRRRSKVLQPAPTLPRSIPHSQVHKATWTPETLHRGLRSMRACYCSITRSSKYVIKRGKTLQRYATHTMASLGSGVVSIVQLDAKPYSNPPSNPWHPATGVHLEGQLMCWMRPWTWQISKLCSWLWNIMPRPENKSMEIFLECGMGGTSILVMMILNSNTYPEQKVGKSSTYPHVNSQGNPKASRSTMHHAPCGDAYLMMEPQQCDIDKQ